MNCKQFSQRNPKNSELTSAYGYTLIEAKWEHGGGGHFLLRLKILERRSHNFFLFFIPLFAIASH